MAFCIHKDILFFPGLWKIINYLRTGYIPQTIFSVDRHFLRTGAEALVRKGKMVSDMIKVHW